MYNHGDKVTWLLPTQHWHDTPDTGKACSRYSLLQLFVCIDYEVTTLHPIVQVVLYQRLLRDVKEHFNEEHARIAHQKRMDADRITGEYCAVHQGQ